MIGAKIRFN